MVILFQSGPEERDNHPTAKEISSAFVKEMVSISCTTLRVIDYYNTANTYIHSVRN